MVAALPLTAAALLVLFAPYAASATTPLTDISDGVQAFLLAEAAAVGDDPEVELAALDPRLKLAACGEPLEFFLPPGGRLLGNTSVGVRCHGPEPWTIYQRARVRAYSEVLVAARHLPRGTVLSPRDVSVRREDLSMLPYGYLPADTVLGDSKLLRPLRPGAVISPRQLQALPLIRRGEQVTIVAQTAGLQVTASGVALEDAAAGERLKVRSAGSERVLEVTAVAPGRVLADP